MRVKAPVVSSAGPCNELLELSHDATQRVSPMASDHLMDALNELVTQTTSWASALPHLQCEYTCGAPCTIQNASISIYVSQDFLSNIQLSVCHEISLLFHTFLLAVCSM